MVARERLGLRVAFRQSEGEDSGEDSLSASIPPKSGADAPPSAQLNRNSASCEKKGKDL